MQNFRADALGARLSLPGNIPFTCKKAPCIYAWTGITIERPETNEADSFRVVPVVPGSDTDRFDNPVKP